MMSKFAETSSGSDTLAMESLVAVSTRDLQNIQAAYQLNGKNYLKLSQLVRTFLKGRRKLSHLLGTGLSEKRS